MIRLRPTLAALAAASLLSPAAAPVAASPLGLQRTPNLNAYCDRHHDATARLTAFTALSWVCVNTRTGSSWGISVKQACKEQFGLPKAAYLDKNDPYSWYCTRPAPEWPGVDLTKHCMRHYGFPAKLVGSGALDWQCYRDANNRLGISVSRACTEQHGLPKASYRDVKDPYSWYCHR